ncbi:MAG: hypothetical protein NZ455_14925 [Bacteroidia bacterium]|nr:hypothetical protein [Bacteroidia bacterium]MDW8347641.1 hypothetical protein [Bacteroidia bacterium]
MGVPLWAFAHKVGVLRATLSLRCFATLRTAHAPSACLTQQPLGFLPHFYTYLYFTLLNAHYQLLTKLKFFTLFELRSFSLVLYSFSSMYKVKP